MLNSAARILVPSVWRPLMRRHIARGGVLLLVMGCLALAAFACGDSEEAATSTPVPAPTSAPTPAPTPTPSPTPTPTPTPTPAPTPTPTPTPLTEADVLERAGAKMAGLKTFHFELTHEVGTSEFLPGLNVEQVAGQLEIPNKLSVEFSGLFGDIPIQVKLIVIDDVNYITNPLTGVWAEVPAANSPVAFFRPQEGIAAVMSSITASFDGPEGDVYRLSGTLPASAFAALIGDTVEDAVVDVTIEVQADSFQLTKIRFAGQVSPLDDPSVVRVVELSRFDEPVTIEVPETAP